MDSVAKPAPNLSRFVGHGPMRFAELSAAAPLTADELELLLAFLDRLLVVAPLAGRRETMSDDHLWHLVLEEPRVAGETAVLTTRAGRFTVPAYTLTVEPPMGPMV